MQVKVKKLDPKAVIPTKAHVNDAGFDLYAVSKEEACKLKGGFIEYGTGLSFEIPEGHVGYLFPRSSISKTDMRLANSVGVIDAGYRGEVKFRFKVPHSKRGIALEYDTGDRIGQLIIMPIPAVTLLEVEELDDTERGSGAFGSSGA